MLKKTSEVKGEMKFQSAIKIKTKKNSEQRKLKGNNKRNWFSKERLKNHIY